MQPLDPTGLVGRLRFDPARSQPFRPHFDLDTGDGDDWVGARLRQGRQQRYGARIAAGWDGPRILADGDSWLLFPLVQDLIAQLEADHAIDCLAGDGDPLRNAIRARQIGEAIVEQRPDAVLLSIGGSDVLDGCRLSAFVEPYARGRLAADYPTAYFVAGLHRELLPRIIALIIGIRSIDARVPVLLHSYAHARPRDFIWLGRPLLDLGIEDPGLQRAVVAALVDRFHTALVQAIATAGVRGVQLVDCRDAVGANWFDELHPNNAGFEAIAARFRTALAAVL